MNTTPSLFRSFAPVRLLVDLNFAAKIWFGLFLFMAFCEAATLVLLLRPRRAEERQVVFIASNGRGYGGNETELSALTNLHVRAAEDVIQAFLNRNPSDFDQPERIILLFQPEAARKARADCDRETPERRLHQLQEKAQITRLQYLEASNQRILFTVQGLLMQSGAFNGQPLVNSLPFQLDLELVPNPNLTLQAAFPLVVHHYRYETHPR